MAIVGILLRDCTTSTKVRFKLYSTECATLLAVFAVELTSEPPSVFANCCSNCDTFVWSTQNLVMRLILCRVNRGQGTLDTERMTPDLL